jgi:hypothetical protein
VGGWRGKTLGPESDRKKHPDKAVVAEESQEGQEYSCLCWCGTCKQGNTWLVCVGGTFLGPPLCGAPSCMGQQPPVRPARRNLCPC